MRLIRLQIDGYKNIRRCDLAFEQPHLINAIIGSNGSGKSNLFEAMLQILMGFYFKRPPSFDFRLEFEAHNRHVVLDRERGRGRASVDGQPMSLDHFSKRLRDGPAQVFYPELTLVYYSGECERVKRLIARYQRHFLSLVRNPDTDRFRPLFLQSSNEQSEVILLAVFAHGHRSVLDHLGLTEISDIRIALRSPDDFDPTKHEPKLWNTQGAIRRIVAALAETSSHQEERRGPEALEGDPATAKGRVVRTSQRQERVYHYKDGGSKGLGLLAQRLAASGDNVYLALEALRARGMFLSVSYSLNRQNAKDSFEFEQLSEGEKQLLAVIGAIKLANQNENLILLDEPDTHLNPHWSWDYPGMLTDALEDRQRASSTVLMATHDPVMISGMVREQVMLAHRASPDQPMFTRPHRNPRGQGVANILCSSEFFGLPSSLDKETQSLLDERLRISVKDTLTDRDKKRLRQLNEQLEILPGVSERDPDFVAFLRARHDDEGRRR